MDTFLQKIKIICNLDLSFTSVDLFSFIFSILYPMINVYGSIFKHSKKKALLSPNSSEI